MDPVVETRLGKLRGAREEGLERFLGIPFAAPPLGARRFAAPEPAAPWAGVRDATRFGPSAPQLPIPFDLIAGMDVGATDEDCLYLNVFAPAADGGRRPVLVWIHGGAFTIGSGSQRMYDARPLVRRGDVVVVTLNYRLGAFGFAHLGLLGVPGAEEAVNLGLQDQVAALRFVREQIAAFGGDPANVTIFPVRKSMARTRWLNSSATKAVEPSAAVSDAGLDVVNKTFNRNRPLLVLGLP